MVGGQLGEAETVFSQLLDRYAARGRGVSSDQPALANRLADGCAQLAIARSRQDHHAEALETIERVEQSFADRLDPALLTSVQYEKAWCLRALGRTEEAATVYRELLAEATGAAGFSPGERSRRLKPAARNGPVDGTAARQVESDIAMNLGSKVNSEFNDYGPALSHDGKSLYFASNRPRRTDARRPDPDAWPGTIREDLYHRTYDLYETSISEHGPGEAKAIDALNTPFNEGAPAISPFQDFIYFASDRPGGEGGFDLYRSRRLRQPSGLAAVDTAAAAGGDYQPPASLGVTVNTAANELDPGLTLGGYALYFSSDRPAKRIDPEAANPYRVYQTTSREVFTETETHRPQIDWAALWSRIGPNLLWALLALIAFLLFLALLSNLKSRKLGLLARCLVASVAVHTLLMMLFHVWQVTAILAQELKGRGPVRIALLAPAGGDDIHSQIRGGFLLSSVEPVEPSTITSERWQAEIESEPPALMARLAVERGPIEIESRTDIRVQTSDARPPRSVKLPTNRPQDVFGATGPVLKLAIPAQTAPTRDSSEPPTSTAKPLAGLAAGPPLLGSEFREPSESIPAVVLQPESNSAATPRPMGKSLAANSTASLRVSTAGKRGGIGKSGVSTRELLQNPVQLAPASPDAFNLSLPQIGSKDTGSEEPDAAIAIIARATSAHSQPEPPRRVLVVEAPAVDPAQSTRELAPARRTPQADGMSLARLPLPRETEVRPANTLSPTRDEDVSSPGLPPGALSLPPLEEATSASAERTYSQPYPARMQEVLRLAITLPADKGSHASPAIASLPPRPIPRELDPVRLSRSSGDPRDAAATIPRRLARAGEAKRLFAVPVPRRQLPSDTALEHRLPLAALGLRLSGEVIGTIRGEVTDASTHEPLPGATVRLDLPDRTPLEVTCDANGRYELFPPEVPTFFALSAASEGHLPSSKNVARDSLRDSTLVLNFELEIETPAVIVVEASPEVHHLGDDDFGGRINSQFQKRSEGSAYAATFTLTPAQLAGGVSVAEVTLLVKGVQMRHRIVVNGQLLSTFLDRAPGDGSFGTFVVRFDPNLLRPGGNTIRILASSRGSDVDDFEFVNLQIRFVSSSNNVAAAVAPVHFVLVVR